MTQSINVSPVGNTKLPSRYVDFVRRVRECCPPAPAPQIDSGADFSQLTRREWRKLGLTDADVDSLRTPMLVLSDEFLNFEVVVKDLLRSIEAPGKSPKVVARRRRKVARNLNVTIEQLAELLRSVEADELRKCLRVMESERKAAEVAFDRRREQHEEARARLNELDPAPRPPRFAYISGETYSIRDWLRDQGWKWTRNRTAWRLAIKPGVVAKDVYNDVLLQCPAARELKLGVVTEGGDS